MSDLLQSPHQAQNMQTHMSAFIGATQNRLNMRMIETLSHSPVERTVESGKYESQVHKQNRARSVWGTFGLGQSCLCRWIFSTSNATSLKPVWTVQECNLFIRSICTMNNLIRPEHSHRQVEKHLAWQHRFFQVLAKHICASSIKHNNVLLSNEFPKKRAKLCYAS